MEESSAGCTRRRNRPRRPGKSEVHILTRNRIPAELVSLPESAWPYGRLYLSAKRRPRMLLSKAKQSYGKTATADGDAERIGVRPYEAPDKKFEPVKLLSTVTETRVCLPPRAREG